MAILRVDSLNIEFNRKKVVSNVNFEIRTGLTAIVGPMNSGKSSILRILATLLKCKEGNLKLDDLSYKDNIIEIRKNIGYIPENVNLYPQLTGKEFLEIVYEIKIKENTNKDKDIEKLISYVGIDKYKDEFINNYNDVTKCKIAIAQAIIGNNKMILMDSILNDLEENEKKEIMKLIVDIAKKSIVVLTTTNKEDILEYYDNLIIIENGNAKILEKRNR